MRKKKDEFKYFFQLYMSAWKKKQLFFIYPFLTQNIFRLIKHLEKKNYISGYAVLNMHNVKIFFRYERTKQNILFPQITFFSSPEKKRFISARILKSFQQYYPNTVALIGTKHGILSLEECQKLNCGGELILSIT
jgi:ribosomal protein S8